MNSSRMHIPWEYLITLTILTCDFSFRFMLKVVYANYEDYTFTDTGSLLITSNKSSSTAQISYPSGSIVYGITIHEEILATALDDIIVVYNISSSVRIEDLHRLRLPTSIRKKLVEFKLIDRKMLLYCDAFTCRFIIFNIAFIRDRVTFNISFLC